jgi:hypothetical protein
MWIKTIRSQENAISQSAYEAIRKQSSLAAPITVNLRPGLHRETVGLAKMLVVVLGLSASEIFIAE